MAATVREKEHRGRRLTRQVVMVLGSPGSGAGMAAVILEVPGYQIPKPVTSNQGSGTENLGESEFLVNCMVRCSPEPVFFQPDARPDAWGATSAGCFDSLRSVQHEGGSPSSSGRGSKWF